MVSTSASAALSALLFFSSQARAVLAAPSARTARIEVRANPACVSREDLAARVLARVPDVRFDADSHALEVRAWFTPLASGEIAGEVLLITADDKISSRKLVARSCAQAADGVALIIAVTLDPNAVASRAPASTAETSAPPPTASEAPNRATPPLSSSATPAKPAKPAPAVKPAPVPSSPAAEAAPLRIPPTSARDEASSRASVPERSRFGLHAAGAGLFGPTPGVLPGFALYGVMGLDREALWSPALVLGATHARRTGIQAEGGTASFTLDAVSLDACTLRLRHSALELRPCGSVLVGRLSAWGRDTQNSPGTVHRPFAALGAAALVTLRLHRVLEASARVGAGVTLIRDSFEFAPLEFHEAWPVTLFSSLGFGVRSP